MAEYALGRSVLQFAKELRPGRSRSRHRRFRANALPASSRRQDRPRRSGARLAVALGKFSTPDRDKQVATDLSARRKADCELLVPLVMRGLFGVNGTGKTRVRDEL